MDEPITRIVDMPYSIRGLSTVDEDGTPQIYINARLSNDEQRKAYDHERRHLENDDLYNKLSIETVEVIASNKLVSEYKKKPKDLTKGGFRYESIKGYKIISMEEFYQNWLEDHPECEQEIVP